MALAGAGLAFAFRGGSESGDPRFRARWSAPAAGGEEAGRAFERGDFETAKRFLEQDERPASGDPADGWSNLAAVHFEKSFGDPLELLEAASAVLRALRIRPDHPQALYNSGLIFEALPLPAAAEQAWLRLAATGAGRVEADLARHLRAARARQSLLPGQVQSRVMEVMDDILPSWQEAVFAGRDTGPAASALLAQAKETAPDVFLSDLDASLRAASGPAARPLAAATRVYLAGRSAWKERDLTRAIPLLREASALLAERSRPL